MKGGKLSSPTISNLVEEGVFSEVGIAPVLAKLGQDRGCAEFHVDVPSMAWPALPALLRP